jgi:exopolyphosphatase / guanosine-5'-triphosphate,3'-diphosphate pyrophosphatase
MKKFAILDIGTNSIKFFLNSIEDGIATKIIDINNISRLGEGLQKTGKISDEAMKRNIEVLREFVGIAKENDVDEIVAVGTMCLRSAKNSKEFVDSVKDELDLKIEVIDGEEEARLSYLAVLSTIGDTDKNVVVFDTGGGSTEFIFGKGKELLNRKSLNIGAIYPTEKFLISDPVTNAELEQMLAFTKAFFEEHKLDKNADYLIGIGGTVTSMGAVMHQMKKYDPNVIQGSTMSKEEVQRQLEMYQSKAIEERKKIIGLQPKRADVILAGAGIVESILEHFSLNKFTLSDSGLRHGLLFDRFLNKD